jgi:hypothetical protein
MGLPRYDLVSHSTICIALFPRKTEIGKLQLALAGEQQVIWFQILQERSQNKYASA